MIQNRSPSAWLTSTPEIRAAWEMNFSFPHSFKRHLAILRSFVEFSPSNEKFTSIPGFSFVFPRILFFGREKFGRVKIFTCFQRHLASNGISLLLALHFSGHVCSLRMATMTVTALIEGPSISRIDQTQQNIPPD